MASAFALSSGMKTYLFLFFFGGLIWNVWAGTQAKDISPLGEHYPLLIFEKSENPQNIMVVFIKLDQECRVVRDPAAPDKALVDFYWLMDRKTYKPVHALIKQNIRSHTEVLPTNDDYGFELRLGDLKELKVGVDNPSLMVKSEKIKGLKGKRGCAVENSMAISAGDTPQKIQIDSIFSDAEKSLLPPFRNLKAVTVTGKDLTSGKPYSRTFKAL